MMPTRRPDGYWTLERCKAAAKPFKTKTDFRKNDCAAYDATKRNGWVNKVCAHMTPLKRPDGYWTKALCAAEAKKFTTKVEFRKGN